MAVDDICVIPYNGQEYALSPRDITISKLRVLKSKFGPEYGAYRPFLNLFLQGDADAIAGALWIVLQKEGVKRPLDSIDFSPYDIFEAINKANKLKDEEDPTAEGESSTTDDLSETTSDSTPERTTSETSTSEY